MRAFGASQYALAIELLLEIGLELAGDLLRDAFDLHLEDADDAALSSAADRAGGLGSGAERLDRATSDGAGRDERADHASSTLPDELLHQSIDHEVAVGDLVLAIAPARLHLFVPLLCSAITVLYLPTFLMMSFWLRTKYATIDAPAATLSTRPSGPPSA